MKIIEQGTELSFDFIQASKHENVTTKYQCHPFGDEFYAEKQS